jgi:uncharacterized protein
MTLLSEETDNLKAQILRNPDAILEDREVMRALIAAGGGLGRNVVDLRGALVDRLESRLDRLEDTHRSVIAAAYENLAGTHQVHRAVLSVLEPTEFSRFLHAAGNLLPNILAVDLVRVGIEASAIAPGTSLGPAGDLHRIVVSMASGGVDAYFGLGRGASRRQVMLRPAVAEGSAIYGDDARWIRSEALMRLDLGAGRRPGVLLFASEDPHRFSADQGTDLLQFFGGVFESAMRRWLA